MSVIAGTCACCLLSVAGVAHGQSAQEVWFVSDVVRTASGSFDCAQTQENAQKTRDLVHARLSPRAAQFGVLLLTTEVNNCRDYNDPPASDDPANGGPAYDFFVNDWIWFSGFWTSNWHAVPGNHDYITRYSYSQAKFISDGYPDSFLAAWGLQRDQNPTWMTYNFGGESPWTVIGLDSELNDATPSGTPLTYGMTAQKTAVASQLASSKATSPCQLMFTHRPAFSNATKHGEKNPPAGSIDRGEGRLDQELVDLLTSNHVDLVFSGHEHVYERLAPMPGSGLVQIVAGTGGAGMDSSSSTPFLGESPSNPVKYARGEPALDANKNPMVNSDRQRAEAGYGVVRALLRSDRTYRIEYYRITSEPQGELYDYYEGTCQL